MESRTLVLDHDLVSRCPLQALGRFDQLGVAEHVFLLFTRDLGLINVDDRATGAFVVPFLVGCQVRAADI